MLIELIVLLALIERCVTLQVTQPEDYKTAIAIKQGSNLENITHSMAVGVSSYKELVQKNRIFIDNTLYIREVYHKHGQFEIMDTGCRLTLYLVPRKWGRTMILDMLKTFLEVPVDENGNKIPKESTSSYKLFHDGEIILENGSSEKLLDPLLVAKLPRVMTRCLCQIPVIYITFKGVSGDNYAMVHNQVNEAIRKAFEEHKYMIKALELNNATEVFRQNTKNAIKFRRILIGKNETFLEPQDIADRIHFLSRILHNYFGRKPFLLLDDYDTPFSSVLRSKNFPARDAEEILQFMRQLIRKIFDEKRTPDIHQAIVMGLFKLDFTDVYDPFCRIIDVTLEKNPVGEYFGFKEKDVKSLFAMHNVSANLSEQACKWYRGRKSIFTNQYFYNPLSIASFLSRKKLKLYRKVDENQDFIADVIKALPKARSTILGLLSKKSFVIDSATVKSFTDISILNAMRHEDYKWTPNEFFFYLYANGYFNANVKLAEALQPTPYVSFKLLFNKEMAHQMATWMISYYQRRYRIEDVRLLKAAQDLLNFVLSSTAITTPLEKSLVLLYRVSRGGNTTEYHTDILRAVVNCVTLKMQCINKFELEAYYEKSVDTDIVIYNSQKQHGVLIDFPTNQPENESDIKTALAHAKIIRGFGYAKIVKFDGNLNVQDVDEKDDQTKVARPS